MDGEVTSSDLRGCVGVPPCCVTSGCVGGREIVVGGLVVGRELTTGDSVGVTPWRVVGRVVLVSVGVVNPWSWGCVWSGDKELGSCGDELVVGRKTGGFVGVVPCFMSG